MANLLARKVGIGCPRVNAAGAGARLTPLGLEVLVGVAAPITPAAGPVR